MVELAPNVLCFLRRCDEAMLRPIWLDMSTKKYGNSSFKLRRRVLDISDGMNVEGREETIMHGF